MTRWRLSDAQKDLSKVVEKALTEGPQTIALSRGQSVVISSKSKSKLKRKVSRHPTLAEVIQAAPRVPEFKIPRNMEYPKPAKFD